MTSKRDLELTVSRQELLILGDQKKIHELRDEIKQLNEEIAHIEQLKEAESKRTRKNYDDWVKAFYEDQATWKRENDRLQIELNKALADLTTVLNENHALDYDRAALQDRETLLENLLTVEPDLERFLDDEGEWREDEIHTAAEWIRGHEAVHAFDKDEPAAEPPLYVFNLGPIQ